MSAMDEEVAALRKRERAIADQENKLRRERQSTVITRQWIESKQKELDKREAALAQEQQEPDEFSVTIPEEFDDETKGLLVRMFGLGAGWTPDRCTGMVTFLASMDPSRRREEARTLLNSIASDNLSPEDLSFESLVGSRSVLKALGTTKTAIEQAGTNVAKQLAMMTPEEASRAATGAIEAMEGEIKRLKKIRDSGHEA